MTEQPHDPEEPEGLVEPVQPEDSAPPEQSVPASQEPVPETPVPAARPVPRPVPRPLPRPTAAAARPPSAGGGTTTPEPAPVHTRPASDPAPWGRVAEDGAVFVRTADGEREVGTAEGDPSSALAPFGVAYDDLVDQVEQVEQRLADSSLAPADAVGTLRGVRAALGSAPVVGDLEGLAQRTRDLEGVAASRRAEADAVRTAAREEARAARAAVVEEAESIAATDPAKMQWRPSGERLRVLLEAWKEQQRSGTKLDKRGEDELWKRFSAARTGFDRARRAHFTALESSNTEAKAAKEAVVAEAEALTSSTDWGSTASAYRQLMDRWRAAGHASRRDDDALWARFRAAQDAFFAARHAAAAVEDEDFARNLVVKEALLTEAEALLPVRDHRAAKAALRDVQERWEAAGKVPRADINRVEGRMRAVEQAVGSAEQDVWRRSNPETRARAEGAIEQLERAVADLRAQLERAEASGDQRAAGDARSSLEARQVWLDLARRAAADAG